MRRATAHALRMRDSRVVLATRGVICSVSMRVQRAARVERTRLEAVEPGRGDAAVGQRVGQRSLVEQRRMRDADDDLVRLAVRQEALAEQAAVAAEVRSCTQTASLCSSSSRSASGSTFQRDQTPSLACSDGS